MITSAIYAHIKQVNQVQAVPDSKARELQFYFFFMEAEYSSKVCLKVTDQPKPATDEDSTTNQNSLMASRTALEMEEGELLVGLSKRTDRKSDSKPLDQKRLTVQQIMQKNQQRTNALELDEGLGAERDIPPQQLSQARERFIN